MCWYPGCHPLSKPAEQAVVTPPRMQSYLNHCPFLAEKLGDEGIWNGAVDGRNVVDDGDETKAGDGAGGIFRSCILVILQLAAAEFSSNKRHNVAKGTFNHIPGTCNDVSRFGSFAVHI